MQAGSSDATSTDVDGRVSDDEVLHPGAVVGRYLVASTIGRGAMGTVYVAYDPELDRRIALKLVTPRSPGALDSSEGRARVLREAQALARLNHPHVVAVHDVGTLGQRVWIAMEYVDGCTLGAWRAEAPRSWPEILEVMMQAGAGLAAAHRAGLLHRDFKPDNVMIGKDPDRPHAVGRVRVMDFGLARAGSTSSADVRAAMQSAVLDLDLTATGALMGTPAYMAPEQLRARPLPASDQFAFCVTLWELLYGARPFGGKSAIDLMGDVLAGRIRSPPRGDVPGWLRRACERGLLPDPEQRHASMQALLDELARGRTRRRRRLTWAASIAAIAVVPTAWVLERVARSRAEAECERQASAVDEVWNDAPRRGIAEAFTESGVNHAAATIERVLPRVDAYADAWRSAWIDVCTAAEIDRSWDAATTERAQWCLDERRSALGSLVTELQHADAQMTHRAVTAVVSLPAVDVCIDARVLANLPDAPPESMRAAAASVRTELARVAALSAAGKRKEASEAAEKARRDAEAMGWPPLSAAAWHSEAIALEGRGAYADAEKAYESAYMIAASAGAWTTAAGAAEALIHCVGFRQARHGEGRVWARHAEVAAVHAGDPVRLHEAYRVHNIGNLEFAAGAYAEAAAAFRHALELREAAFGPEHPQIAMSLNNLSNVERALGHFDEAARFAERAVAIRETVLGPDNPEVGYSLTNLAVVYNSMNDHARARPLHERALAIFEQALGPDHPDVATSLHNLALGDDSPENLPNAEALLSRALSIRERVLGPEHPDVAGDMAELAYMRLRLGRGDEALTLAQRAVDVFAKRPGVEEGEPTAAFVLARVLLATQGDRDGALKLARSALDQLRMSRPEKTEQIAEIEAWLAAEG